MRMVKRKSNKFSDAFLIASGFFYCAFIVELANDDSPLKYAIDLLI